MSYCRFSSDNFRSDVYVYEDVYGGWTTHVAGNRFCLPPLFPWPFSLHRSLIGKWDPVARRAIYPSKRKQQIAGVYYRVFGAWESVRNLTLEHIPRRRIDLPHAGKRFNDPTPGDCAARLRELRAIGYHVPQYAIDSLVYEQHRNFDQQSA